MYWFRDYSFTRDKDVRYAHGQCRRYPPRQRDLTSQLWPEMSPYEYCGEFRHNRGVFDTVQRLYERKIELP